MNRGSGVKTAPSLLGSDQHKCDYDVSIQDFSDGRDFAIENGMKVILQGTEDIFKYTRLCLIGNKDNVTRIYFAVHGDGNPDYSGNFTQKDRDDLQKFYPKGEGLILALPIAVRTEWADFNSLSRIQEHYYVFLHAFNHLKHASKNPKVTFEMFSLSGGDLVNWALFRFVRDKYDEDPEVKLFVDNHLRGSHDADALSCRGSYSDIKETYVGVLKRHTKLKAAFVHRRAGSGTQADIYERHFGIAKLLDPNVSTKDFTRSADYGESGSLRLENARFRFWSGPSHGQSWSTQFARVFLDIDPDTATSPAQEDRLNFDTADLKTIYDVNTDTFTVVLKNAKNVLALKSYMKTFSFFNNEGDQQLSFACSDDSEPVPQACTLKISNLGEKTRPYKWQVDLSNSYFVIRNDDENTEAMKDFHDLFTGYQTTTVEGGKDEHVGIPINVPGGISFVVPDEDQIMSVSCRKHKTEDRGHFCKILVKIPSGN